MTDIEFKQLIQKYIDENAGIIAAYNAAPEMSYKQRTKESYLNEIVLATKNYSSANDVTQADRDFVARYLNAGGQKTPPVESTTPTTNTTPVPRESELLPERQPGTIKSGEQSKVEKGVDKAGEEAQANLEQDLNKISNETIDKGKQYNFHLPNLLKGPDIDYLSGEDYATTLKKSRLMDYLNNRLWSSPVGIGARHHTVNGASGTDLSNVVSGSKPHRKDAATTEDMRQMDIMRQIESKRLNEVQEKQNAQYMLEHTMNQLSADKQMQFATMLAQLDYQQQTTLLNKIFDFEYLKRNEAQLSQWAEEESMKRGMRFKVLAADIVDQLAKDDYIKANILGQQFGIIAPNAFTQLSTRVLDKILDATYDDGTLLTATDAYTLAIKVMLDIFKKAGVGAMDVFKSSN